MSCGLANGVQQVRSPAMMVRENSITQIDANGQMNISAAGPPMLRWISGAAKGAAKTTAKVLNLSMRGGVWRVPENWEKGRIYVSVKLNQNFETVYRLAKLRDMLTVENGWKQRNDKKWPKNVTSADIAPHAVLAQAPKEAALLDPLELADWSCSMLKNSMLENTNWLTLGEKVHSQTDHWYIRNTNITWATQSCFRQGPLLALFSRTDFKLIGLDKDTANAEARLQHLGFKTRYIQTVIANVDSEGLKQALEKEKANPGVATNIIPEARPKSLEAAQRRLEGIQQASRKSASSDSLGA